MDKSEAGGIYLIRVTGMVDPSVWTDRLGGLAINPLDLAAETCKPVTELAGWLPDQAALLGVLNTLYNNRYELISVTLLEKGKNPALNQSR